MDQVEQDVHQEKAVETTPQRKSKGNIRAQALCPRIKNEVIRFLLLLL